MFNSSSKKFSVYFSLYFIPIVATVLLVGCSDKNITGQAFFELDGHTNKIANLRIDVVDIDISTLTDDRADKLVKNAIKHLENEEANLIKINQESITLANIQSILLKNEGWYKPIDYGYVDKIGGEILKLKEIISSRNINFEKQLIEISNLQHPFLYFDKKADKPSATTFTDADGKFQLEIKKSNKSFVFAQQKSFMWMMATEKIKYGKINMNSYNLYNSDCDTCFLAKLNNGSYQDKIKLKLSYFNPRAKHDSFVKKCGEPINDDLLGKVKSLEKLALYLGNEIGAVTIEKSRSNWVGLGAAEQQLKVQLRELKLQENFIKARELHKDYSKQLENRVIELMKKI